VVTGGPRQAELAERALGLSRRASDRARLLILAHVGLARSDPRAVAAAETLATRFPNDPEALTRAAAVSSDFSRATALLNHAVAIDSTASIDPSAVCRVCEALDALAQRYADADSIAAVERTYARWSRLRPGDYTPWRELADVLLVDGRVAAADAALRRADSLGAPRDEPDVVRLERRLRADDLDGANAICRVRLESATGEELARIRRPCVIALRMQGRYRDALTLVRSGRAPGSRIARRDLPDDPEHEAILDFEMGRPQIAADQLARQAAAVASSGSALEGTAPGRVAWLLTLAATASGAASDTIRVRTLVDSVATLGARSLDPRDQRLHHFLRGLLLASSGQHEGAVRAFRSAISSPVHGYTRINLELARSLIALRRPAEAVPMLRAALHGGFGESEVWVTRTELHEALGDAFAAAGATDSAAVHYQRVLRAWRDADPLLASRREVVGQWLARHGRPGA
jgi:tetratricopeptide (TPR) repeat protein